MILPPNVYSTEHVRELQLFLSDRRLLIENIGFVLLIRKFVFLANQAIHALTFNKNKPSQTCLLTKYVCFEEPLVLELVFLA